MMIDIKNGEFKVNDSLIFSQVLLLMILKGHRILKGRMVLE